MLWSLLLLATSLLSYTAPTSSFYSIHTSSSLSPLSSVHPGVSSTISSLPISNVSTVDDWPLEAHALPFAFPFYNQAKRTAWINPNGAVQFDTTLCCQLYIVDGEIVELCFYQGGSCTLETAWRNLVAACVTDLNPAEDSAARVHWATTERAFTVAWEDMPMYMVEEYNGEGRGMLYRFSVTLFRSGRVVLRYTKVYDPVPVGGWGGSVRTWMVGLRHASRDAKYANRLNTGWVGFADYSVQPYEPRTMVANGTYAPREAVVDGSTVTFWPAEAEICVVPQLLRASGGSAVRVTIDLLGLQFLEEDGVDLFCQFRVVGVDANGTATAITTLRTAATIVDTELYWLECAAPNLVNATSGGGVNATVSVVGVADAGTSSEHELLLGLESDASVVHVLPDTHEFWSSPESSELTSLQTYCSRCHALRPLADYCVADCAGRYNGTAALDECGVCAGGTTGKTAGADVDCFGVCFGDFWPTTPPPPPTFPNSALCTCQGPECVALSGEFGASPPAVPSGTSRTRCITPRFGSASGGAFVRISNVDAAAYPMVSENVTLYCDFRGASAPERGSAAVVASVSEQLMPAIVSSAGSIECQVPRGVANATVRVRLWKVPTPLYLGEWDATPSDRNATMLKEELTANQLFFTYLDDSDERLASELADPLEASCHDCDILGLDCSRDCAGDIQGSATVDSCGVCAGGATGIVPDAELDCLGVCFGSFRTLDVGDSVLNCVCYDNDTAPGQPDWECAQYAGPLQVPADPSASPPPRPPFACVTPRFGPSTGGTSVLISVRASLDALQLNASDTFTCLFGNKSSPAVLVDHEGTTPVSPPQAQVGLRWMCEAPPLSLDNATVLLRLQREVTRTLVLVSGDLFFTYLPPTHAALGQLADRAELECYDCSDAAIPNIDCSRDCAGQVRGDAELDGCGVCSGGRSGHVAETDRDCAGYCFGNFSVTTGLTPNRCVCTPEFDCTASSGVFPGAPPLSADRGDTACVAPRRAPETGGTAVTVGSASNSSLFVPFLHDAALEARLRCDFGGLRVSASVLRADEWSAIGRKVACTAPPGPVNTTVPLTVGVLPDGLTTEEERQTAAFERVLLGFGASSSQLFFTYLDSNSTVYAAEMALSAEELECRDCALLAEDCTHDCTGLLRGTAELDHCDVCAGGTTGHVANSDKDCAGVCFGAFFRPSSECVCPGGADVGLPSDAQCFNYSGAIPGPPPQRVVDGSSVCVTPRYGHSTVLVGVADPATTFAPILATRNGSSVAHSRWGSARTDLVANLTCGFGGTALQTTAAMAYGEAGDLRVACPVPEASGMLINSTVALSLYLSTLAEGSSSPSVIQIVGESSAAHSGSLFFTFLSDDDPRAAAVEAQSTLEAVERDCQDCGHLSSLDCSRDCAGRIRGHAIVDDCGECTLGTTGLDFNRARDCEGTCFGNFTALSVEVPGVGSASLCHCVPENGEAAGLPGGSCTSFSGLIPGPVPARVDTNPLTARFCLTPRYNAVDELTNASYVYISAVGGTAEAPPFFEELVEKENQNNASLRVRFFCDFGGALSEAEQHKSAEPSGSLWRSLSQLRCLPPAHLTMHSTVTVRVQYATEPLDDPLSPLEEIETFATVDGLELFFTRVPASHPAVTEISLRERACVDCGVLVTTGAHRLNEHGDCSADCAGTQGGAAFEDDCGVCSGRLSGHEAGSDKDCAGVCFGNFTVVGAANQCACADSGPGGNWSSLVFATPESSCYAYSGSYSERPSPPSTSCASPRFGAASGGTAVQTTLRGLTLAHLVGNATAGGESVEFWCDYGGVQVGATFNESVSVISCTSPPASGGAYTTVPFAVRMTAADETVVLADGLYFSFVPDGDSHLAQNATQRTEVFCSDCAAIAPSQSCRRDCTGLLQGTAQVDDCGVCSGGQSGNVRNAAKDCAGACFGPFLVNATWAQPFCGCVADASQCAASLVTAAQLSPRVPPSVGQQYLSAVVTRGSAKLAKRTVVRSVTFSSGAREFEWIDLPLPLQFYGMQYSRVAAARDGTVRFPLRASNASVQSALQDSHSFATAYRLSREGETPTVYASAVNVTADSESAAFEFASPQVDSVLTVWQDGRLRFEYLRVDGSPDSAVQEPFVGAVAPPLLPPATPVSLPVSSTVATDRVAEVCSLGVDFCVSPVLVVAQQTVQVSVRGDTTCLDMFARLEDATHTSDSSVPVTLQRLSCAFGGVVTGNVRYTASRAVIECDAPDGTPGVSLQVSLVQHEPESEVYIATPERMVVTFVRSVANPEAQARCKLCGDVAPSQCPADCSGEFGGSYVRDGCGMCVPGDGPAVSIYRDCDGVCFGPSERLAEYNANCGCVSDATYSTGELAEDGIPLPQEYKPCAFERTDGPTRMVTALDSIVAYRIFIGVLAAVVAVGQLVRVLVPGADALGRRVLDALCARRAAAPPKRSVSAMGLKPGLVRSSSVGAPDIDLHLETAAAAMRLHQQSFIRRQNSQTFLFGATGTASGSASASVSISHIDMEQRGDESDSGSGLGSGSAYTSEESLPALHVPSGEGADEEDERME